MASASSPSFCRGVNFQLPPGHPMGLEHLEPVAIELADQGARPVLGEAHPPGDVRGSEPLGAREDHLGPSELDRFGRVASDPLEALTFLVGDPSNSDDHARG